MECKDNSNMNIHYQPLAKSLRSSTGKELPENDPKYISNAFSYKSAIGENSPFTWK